MTVEEVWNLYLWFCHKEYDYSRWVRYCNARNQLTEEELSVVDSHYQNEYRPNRWKGKGVME